MASRKRKTVRATWARRDYLVDALADYERIAKAALGAGRFGDATKAKQCAVVTRGQLDQLDKAEAAAALPESIEEHLHEMIRRVRSMGAAAEAAQSFVAATKLVSLEAELVRALDAHKQGEDDADRPLEELIEEATAIMTRLPLAVVARS